MDYTLENQDLKIEVACKGAELTGVLHKATGRQMLWQANPAVWGRHAPLLFPYCGRLWGNKLVAKGKEYPAAQHGFARDLPFTCVRQDAQALVFRLAAGPETQKFFPYDFILEVTYTLQGATLQQAVAVQNPARDETLPFTVGFHPAFALPFNKGDTTEEYEFAFDERESPQVVQTPGGYVSGQRQTLFAEKATLPLSDTLFAQDSICLTGLRSRHITLRKKGPGAGYIRLEIDAFPYTLLWGPPTGPLPFVCIEPWHGLPDGPAQYGEFMDKPGLTKLAPKGRYETALNMEFYAE